MSDQSRLTVDLKPGDKINIGDNVEVELLPKSGRMSRLRVSAPRDVPISRHEQEEAVKTEKKPK